MTIHVDIDATPIARIHGKPWSDEEIAIATAMRKTRASADAIAARLGRTRATVYTQLRKLGVIIEEHRRWDADERARLVEAIRADGLKAAAAAFGTTVEAARYQMELAGERIATLRPPVPKAAKAPKAPRVRKIALPKVRSTRFWSDADDARLTAAVAEQREAGIRDRAALAALFPERTAEAVRLRVLTLKLEEAPATMGKAPAEKIATIEALIRDGVPLKRIVDEAETTHRTVHRVAERLGLTIALPAPRPKAEPLPKPPKPPRVARPKAPPTPRVLRVKEKPAMASSVLAAEAAAAKLPLPVARPAPRPIPVVVTAPPMTMPEPVAVRFVAPVQREAPKYGRSRGREGRKVERDAETMALIASHLASKGVTRVEEAPHEVAIQRLRRRGYIVVREGDVAVIDHKHRLPDPAAIVAFAEARGLV